MSAGKGPLSCLLLIAGSSFTGPIPLSGVLPNGEEKRCLHVSRLTGSAFVVVDAKNEGAARFYEKFGFKRFPDQLFLPVKVISEILPENTE